MSDGIVIIGAGHAGVSAAFAAREAGFEALVTLIGDDPEWPYERPPLSKWAAQGPAARPIMAPDQFSAQRIDLLRGETATKVAVNERQVHLQSGRKQAYSKLLLATGARARQLPPLQPDAPSYHTLRSLADAQSLSRRIRAGDDVLMLGGGFIGLELAASLRSCRAFVHVVETQARILSRALPKEISNRVHALHAGHGITVHTQTAVRAFQGNVVHLTNGQTVRADHVIAGVGSEPNTKLAVAAGAKVRNGILVDRSFATSVPGIFAAGDCCAAPVGGPAPIRQESWAVAGDQGRRAGQIMAGAQPDDAEPPWFWSDQYDHGLQVVGIPTPEVEIVQRQAGEGGLLCAQFSRDGRVQWAAGIAPGNAIGRDIAVIRKMMQKRTIVTPKQFADPAVSLKYLLKAKAAPC